MPKKTPDEEVSPTYEPRDGFDEVEKAAEDIARRALPADFEEVGVHSAPPIG